MLKNANNHKLCYECGAMSDPLQELIEMQQKLLLELGRRIVPTLTSEDLLQPNDYPALDNHPLFRYEEGVLAGLLSAQMAIAARLQEQNDQ